MADTATIDFWFSIGSTYSYLSVMRLADIEKDTGIRFNWRPFSVRTIMREMNNAAFTGKPVKAAYMWRDIERRAAMYGLPVYVPAPYPLTEFEFVNRVAVLAAQEGWCAAFVRACYVRWFQQGLEAGCEPSLSQSLQEAGQDPIRVVPLARSEEIGRALEAATDQARGLRIFGSPSYVVDGEVFWGDDRLNDAISWRRHGAVRA